MNWPASAFSVVAMLLLCLAACDSDRVASTSAGRTATGGGSAGAGGQEHPDCEVVVDLDGSATKCSAMQQADPAAVPDDVVAQFCSPAADPSAPTLLVIGDSFSQGLSQELYERFGANVRHCSLSRHGARTSAWMADEDIHNVGYGVRSIALAILQQAHEPALIVSIGAPDVGNDHLALGNGVYQRVHCDLAAMFAEFSAAKPDVDISITGYGITNFNPGFVSQTLSLSCPEAAAQQMDTPLVYDDEAGALVVQYPRCANTVLYGLRDVFAALAEAAVNVRYKDVYGTLQDLPAGQPDLDRFANPVYYDDCVHLSAAGRHAFIDAYTAAVEGP